MVYVLYGVLSFVKVSPCRCDLSFFSLSLSLFETPEYFSFLSCVFYVFFFVVVPYQICWYAQFNQSSRLRCSLAAFLDHHEPLSAAPTLLLVLPYGSILLLSLVYTAFSFSSSSTRIATTAIASLTTTTTLTVP